MGDFPASRARPHRVLASQTPGALTFGEVNRAALLAAAEALADLLQEAEEENAHDPESVRAQRGGELRLLRTIQHWVVPEMLKRVAG